jgi:ABC-type Fe3+-hydroxamate transport system substrate-binding protein
MRLVSLCPSITETVFALGRGADLVGRTKFCIHPRPAVDAVERVGGTKNPRIARIVELRPDLVLMNDEENRREDALALGAAGVTVLSSFPHDVAGAADAVRELGRAIDARAQADALAETIAARVASLAAARTGARPTRFAYLIWRAPWMAVGPDTYIDSLCACAGGDNVFPGRGRYFEVDAAALAAARPDVVLLSSEPFPFKPRHAAELVAATGLPAERVRLVDGELCSWHGARTPAGLDYAADVLRLT